MPLPIILGVVLAKAAVVGAATVGVAGVGAGVHGAVKMKDANDTMKAAEKRHKRNIKCFENESTLTNKAMDQLGELELQILKSFDEFSDLIEMIQNRPKFKEYSKNGVTLPQYDQKELERVSIGAGVVLGGLSGAALGTAGGVAAAGATTVAVMTLGTASTGTAIATLSGAAATNATLAALGGGAIAAGGGGIALGTTVLSAATLGVGLLVGGVIFSFTGSKLSDKADEALRQAKEAEAKINKINQYLIELRNISNKYQDTLKCVDDKYRELLNGLKFMIYNLQKTNWFEYNEIERKNVQNLVLLVGLLYKMCQVKIVEKTDDEDGINIINNQEVDNSIHSARTVMSDL